MSPTRLPDACPWPTAGALGEDLPCEIEYYVGARPQPRMVRRLRYDVDGRVHSYSDHRDGRVVNARRVTYEGAGQHLDVHDYARMCEAPAPQHLYSQRFTFDDSWRLSSWHSGAATASLRYSYEPRFLGAEAIAYTRKAGKNSWARLNEHGHAQDRGEGPAANGSSRTSKGTLKYSAHRLADFEYVDTRGDTLQSGHYAYDNGRPVSLVLEGPKRATQRYVFRYACTSTPGCQPGSLPVATSVSDRVGMAWDPDLKHYAAADCSDHFAHGGLVCGHLMDWGTGFHASCCKTSVDEIQVRSDSPLTRGRVGGMILEQADGTALHSTYCARADERKHAAWSCRFPRAQLLSLSGHGAIRVVDSKDQTIMQDRVDLDALGAAAH